MKNNDYISTTQLARILNITRIAVYKKIKKGQIKAKKVGRNFVISAKEVEKILSNRITGKDKRNIERAVKKVVLDYGEVLRQLGME